MKNKKSIMCLILTGIMALTACQDNKNSSDQSLQSTSATEKTSIDLEYDFEKNQPNIDDEDIDRTQSFTPYEKQTDGPVYEQASYVENTQKIDFDKVYKPSDLLLGKTATVETEDGEEYVLIPDQDGYTGITFEIPLDGKYSVEVKWKTTFTIYPTFIAGLNHRSTPEVRKSEDFITYGAYNVDYTKGQAAVKISGIDAGEMRVQEIRIYAAEKLSDDIYNVSAELSNPNANDKTKRLMKFIVDNYGKNMITGQTSNNALASQEFKKIYNTTGHYPAMCGFDMIEYSPSRRARGSRTSAIDNAIRWYNVENGIVEFAWHWNAPQKYLADTGSDYEGDQKWWKGFYTEASSIKLDKIMNGEDEEGYQLLLDDIDAIAKQLKIMQEYDVPVLWRPLHEASGGWFWWGASGPEAYIKLWRLMYDRMTNYHGLNNLIWVYNGQHVEWYPGDDVVDIVGEDIYPDKLDVTPQESRFKQAIASSGENKVIALTENGNMPDIDMMLEQNVMWSWFCTWEGDFILDKQSDFVSESNTPREIVIKAFNHENTITLDELPDLKTYPLD